VVDRVLASRAAQDAIGQLANIINGDFATQITKMDQQGQILSDPNNWDGPLALQFRSQTWPETRTALDKAKAELDALRNQLHTISVNIMQAGGGS